MAQPEKKAATLSKDEVGYEKRFSVSTAELDPEFVEGGKRHREVASDLGTCKMIFELFEERLGELKKMKIDPGDKKKVRVAASADRQAWLPGAGGGDGGLEVGEFGGAGEHLGADDDRRGALDPDLLGQIDVRLEARLDGGVVHVAQ